MADDSRKQKENPLEDAAAELSAGLDGQTVEMTDASKDRVQGGQVHMKNSAARTVEASALRMEESAAAFVRSGSLEADSSALAFVFAREAHLNDANASLLVGKQIQADQVRTVFLVAGKSEGNIRAMFTPLTALALGAGFSIVSFALRLLAKRWLDDKRQTSQTNRGKKV